MGLPILSLTFDVSIHIHSLRITYSWFLKILFSYKTYHIQDSLSRPMASHNSSGISGALSLMSYKWGQCSARSLLRTRYFKVTDDVRKQYLHKIVKTWNQVAGDPTHVRQHAFAIHSYFNRVTMNLYFYILFNLSVVRVKYPCWMDV